MGSSEELILILLGVLPLGPNEGESEGAVVGVPILLGVLPLGPDEGESEGAVVGVPEEEDVGLGLILILLGVLPLGADEGESEGAVVGVDVVGPAIGDAVEGIRVRAHFPMLATHCNL